MKRDKSHKRTSSLPRPRLIDDNKAVPLFLLLPLLLLLPGCVWSGKGMNEMRASMPDAQGPASSNSPNPTHTSNHTGSMEQPLSRPSPPPPPLPEWKQTDVLDTGSTFRVYFQGDLPSSSSSSSSHSLPHQEDKEEIVLVFLHGAGHTGVSWTLPCIELGKLIGMTQEVSPPPLLLLAPDLPFHGQTKVVPNDGDMSMKRLVRELLSCLKACLHAEEGEDGKKRKRSLTLVGHSVGGACAIRLAQEPGLAALGTLKGICVVDMVEGAAMASLSHMHDRLQEVPQRFESVEAAIEWSLGAGHVLKNEESAALSVPAQLRKVVRGKRRGREGEEGNGDGGGGHDAESSSTNNRGGEEGGGATTTTNEDDEHHLEEHHYEWITDLRATELFWEEWFQGLSSAFLSPSLHPTPKLLILANYSLLECDRAICAAQMQGMFEMQFMQGGGHALMEDFPLMFARTLYRFLRRNRIVKEGGMEGGEGGGVGGRRECVSPVCGGQQQQQQQQHRSRSESPAHHPPSARYQQPHQHHHSHSHAHQYRSVSPSSSTSSSSSSSSSSSATASSHNMHSSSGNSSSSSSSSSS